MANAYLKPGRPSYERKDCSVIAFAYAFDLDYPISHAICKKAGRDDKYGFSLHNVLCHSNGHFLKDYQFRQFEFHNKKFIVTLYPRPKMTVKRFHDSHPTGTFIARVGNHLFCIKDGIRYNQTKETSYISYYFKIVQVL